jgi:hypothetical protein
VRRDIELMMLLLMASDGDMAAVRTECIAIGQCQRGMLRIAFWMSFYVHARVLQRFSASLFWHLLQYLGFFIASGVVAKYPLQLYLFNGAQNTVRRAA